MNHCKIELFLEDKFGYRFIRKPVHSFVRSPGQIPALSEAEDPQG